MRVPNWIRAVNNSCVTLSDTSRVVALQTIGDNLMMYCSIGYDLHVIIYYHNKTFSFFPKGTVLILYVFF